MKHKLALQSCLWLVLVAASCTYIIADETHPLEERSTVIARGKSGIVSYFICQYGSISTKDCVIQVVVNSSGAERLTLGLKDTSLQDAKGRDVKIAVKQVGANSQSIQILQDEAHTPWLLKVCSSKESQVRMNLRIKGIVPVERQ